MKKLIRVFLEEGKRRIEFSLLLLCGLAVVMIVIFASTSCDGGDGIVTPIALKPQPEPSATAPPSGGTNPTVTPPSLSGCDIIRLERAGVKVETHCEKGVRFYVPADPTIGKGYFNVWMPAVNDGEKFGPFAYYTWTKWLEMDPGTYGWALAAETKTDDGTVYQCDRHKGDFTIPTCKVHPRCPSDAYFNITTEQIGPKRTGRTCPDFESYAYKVSTNLPIVEIILPPGCSATSPTTGTCEFAVEKETYQVILSGRGFIWNLEQQLQCGSDFENIVIEGCCDACENAELSIEQTFDPDTLIIGNPPEGMWYTVGGSATPHYTGNIYAIGVACDASITVRVNLNSDICAGPFALWQNCAHWDFVFDGPECLCTLECPPGYHLHPEECECICDPNPDTRECEDQEWIEELCIWEGECPPCIPIPPNPPLCDNFGDPVFAEWNEETCKWECPPCALVCEPDEYLDTDKCECICNPIGEPECQEQIWNEETCEWEGECPCEYGYVEPGCYEGNVETAQHLYEAHGVCMTRIIHEGEKGVTCWPAATSTDLVVVKAGPSYKIFLDVTEGQLLCSCTYPDRPQHDISHISYFMCDAGAICGVVQ